MTANSGPVLRRPILRYAVTMPASRDGRTGTDGAPDPIDGRIGWDADQSPLAGPCAVGYRCPFPDLCCGIRLSRFPVAWAASGCADRRHVHAVPIRAFYRR